MGGHLSSDSESRPHLWDTDRTSHWRPLGASTGKESGIPKGHGNLSRGWLLAKRTWAWGWFLRKEQSRGDKLTEPISPEQILGPKYSIGPLCPWSIQQPWETNRVNLGPALHRRQNLRVHLVKTSVPRQVSTDRNWWIVSSALPLQKERVLQ